jgi:hypothetical protein
MKSAFLGIKSFWNYWVFGLCPLSIILKNKNKREHNVLETGSVSIFRRRGGDTYSVGNSSSF